ncbi:MAG TPA: acyl-CoA dehydrogenase [Dehalococcoidia bacterium]|nr:acyl-CoA dehydrogenase [Dehalococcoidia bacterium]
MEFSFTPEQERLRREVREFLQKTVTDESRLDFRFDRPYCPDTWKVLRGLGEHGWLCPLWPKEWGGIHATPLDNYVIQEELAYAYAPAPFAVISAMVVGPTLLLHGSDEQKKKFLPMIARGEVEFSMGYTEPQSGSDLASLALKAEDKGDYYLLNGQKMFSTKADFAEYGWVAVRTDAENPKKHKGISLLIIDLKNTPGVTIRPIYSMSGYHSNEVFYDDVRVPKENLVGEENQGFYIIGAALLFERAVTISGFHRPLEELVEYVKNTKRHGKPLSEDPLIRRKLADIEMKFAVTGAISRRLCWMQEKKLFALTETAMSKLLSTEIVYDMANAGMQIMGPYGELASDSKYAELHGWFAHIYQESPHYKIAGGTSEIQRQIISTRGLGLPRG